MENNKYRKLNKNYWKKYDDKKRSYYCLELSYRLEKRGLIERKAVDAIIKVYDLNEGVKIGKNTQNYEDRYLWYFRTLAFFEVFGYIEAYKNPIKQYITKYLNKNDKVDLTLTDDQLMDAEMDKFEKTKIKIFALYQNAQLGLSIDSDWKVLHWMALPAVDLINEATKRKILKAENVNIENYKDGDIKDHYDKFLMKLQQRGYISIGVKMTAMEELAKINEK